MANIFNAETDLNSSYLAGYGRLKTSESTILLSGKQSSSTRELTFSSAEISGSNTTSVFDSNRNIETIGVGTTVGLRRFRTKIAGTCLAGKQSNYRINYNFKTTGQADVIKRVGFAIDGEDGYFLVQENNVLTILERTTVSGSLVSNSIARASWDDPFDGTGESGFTYDQTKGMTFYVSLKYPGGNVECGFLVDDEYKPIYTFQYENALTIIPYIKSPNLFPTWEIERTSAGGTAEELDCGDCCVESEGQAIEEGEEVFLSRTPFDGSRYTTGALGGVWYPIVFRLDPNAINARVKLVGVSGAISSSSDYYVLGIRNITKYLSEPYTPTWETAENTSVQFDLSPNDDAPNSKLFFDDALGDPGLSFYSKLFGSIVLSEMNSTAHKTFSARSKANENLAQTSFLTSSADGTPEIYAIGFWCDGNSETVELCSVNLIEFK